MQNSSRILVVAVAAGLTVAAWPTAGDAAWWPWSKRDRTTQEAPPPPAEPMMVDPFPTDDPLVNPADLPARLDRAEARIRELTGQVEELAFQLQQTQEQLARLQGLTGQAPVGQGMSPQVASRQAAPVAAETDPFRSAAHEPAPAQVAAAPAGQPGDVVIDAPQDQPIDLTAMAREGESALPRARGPIEVVSLGEPGADYDQAYASILSGDYELAEASFRTFLAAYPGDQRASDAQYWLGESLFARGQFREAADEFLSGYKSHPESGKSADTLLKLGLSLAGLGEREAACSTYAEVLKKYPQSSNALRQRVATEQAVASC